MHIPVLQKEVLKYLEPKPNENFIDCTIGEGGHSAAILERILPEGKVLGIDYQLRIKPKERLVLAEDNFVNLSKIVEKYKFRPVHGILFDLGMSSWHLEQSGKGFTFQREEPLIMNYSITGNLTAEKIINEWPAESIEKILRDYGEERFAQKISQVVCEKRQTKPIKTTFQLIDIIKRAVPKKYQHQRIHFATRTFQALRIAVNDELNNLKQVLPQTLQVLKPAGRLVIISFHSLEDRIVKNFLLETAKNQQINILTKKPVTPLPTEIKTNPRSRSAKLRAAVKVSNT